VGKERKIIYIKIQLEGLLLQTRSQTCLRWMGATKFRYFWFSRVYRTT